MYLTSPTVPGGVSGGFSGARSVTLPENFEHVSICGLLGKGFVAPQAKYGDIEVSLPDDLSILRMGDGRVRVGKGPEFQFSLLGVRMWERVSFIGVGVNFLRGS